jgi:predicted alpha/beta hydrolase family esterase
VDFAPVPYHTLPYRSVVVASSNDPYCPVRTAGAYARSWGSEFVRLQNAGHINIDSGFGAWPLGLALLQSLVETPLVFKTTTSATPHHSLELQTV